MADPLAFFARVAAGWSHGRPGSRVRLLGASVAAAAILGCAQAEHAGNEVARELNPFSSTEARVNAISQLGPYLLVELRGGGANLELFTPPSEACARVLEPEAAVTYAKYGNFGRVTRGDGSCTPVGVASLAAWRDRSYRPRGRPVPRAQVQFVKLFESKQLVLLRGRFPLAGRIGIPAGYDLVAMLANDDVCRPLVERGFASMEYRDAGNLPYALVGDRVLCPVLGFANPPDAPAPSE